MPAKEAKELALLAHRKCGGDTGGKDIAHVWRIPETLNHPDWRKMERGRPEAPQPVRLIGGTLEPVNVEELRAALEAMQDLYPELKPGDGAEWQGGGSEDVAGIVKWLKPAVRKKIGEPGHDRSKHCFSVLLSLFEAGLTDAEALLVADKAPFAANSGSVETSITEISAIRLQWIGKGRKRRQKTAALKASPPVLHGPAGSAEEQRSQDGGGSTHEDAAAEIAALACMKVIDFAKAKKKRAAALGISATDLEKQWRSSESN